MIYFTDPFNVHLFQEDFNLIIYGWKYGIEIFPTSFNIIIKRYSSNYSQQLYNIDVDIVLQIRNFSPLLCKLITNILRFNASLNSLYFDFLLFSNTRTWIYNEQLFIFHNQIFIHCVYALRTWYKYCTQLRF